MNTKDSAFDILLAPFARAAELAYYFGPLAVAIYMLAVGDMRMATVAAVADMGATLILGSVRKSIDTVERCVVLADMLVVLAAILWWPG